jgi:peptidyl-prolyl cis-trans isomerase B (cyclophilin B)
VSTNQQRREAAKRKLERQQQRRAEREQRRKRTTVIVAVAAVVTVVAVVVACATIGSSDKPADNAAGQPAPGACSYPTDSDGPSRPVSTPTDTNPPRQGTVAVTMVTNQGVLPLKLDRAKAPCTVASFLHLAENVYYDNTPCHRLVTGAGLKVLQCGDPTGKGTGGPGYTIPDEPPTGLAPAAGGGASIYPRGTLAMAKTSQPNSGGSQFFLVYADSQLPPKYTIFGTVDESGIKVLEKIAAAGDDGSGSTGDGKPKLATTIQAVAVAAS